jgi:nitrogen fixation protein NifB
MKINNGNAIDKHPCFNESAKGNFGRIHLPVAPKCNIQCNYCNRKYDCVNETRPGVTSAILTPQQAQRYLKTVMEKQPTISTLGIAGPGDPMANPEETLTTLRLARQRWPQLLLCLATNGLNLPPYLDELVEIGVSHVTLTINAVDTQIGRQIYSWVRDNKVIYRGQQAAELLLERQIESIIGLKKRNVIVKVNTIIIPWLNDQHAIEVAERMSNLGVDLLNCMPMYPNAGTAFEHIPEPSKELLDMIRNEAENYIPQMRHCARCRADAVGFLGDDSASEFRDRLFACAAMPTNQDKNERPYVAVASMEGALINQHLGRAPYLLIYRIEGDDYVLTDTRQTPEPGSGWKRWADLARLLHDCRALCVSEIGENPQKILEEKGIRVITMYGLIEDGLEAAFQGKETKGLKPKRLACADRGCKGAGGGCG